MSKCCSRAGEASICFCMIVQYREDVGILISCTYSKPYTAFLAHRMVGRDDVTFSGSFDARGSAPAISTEPFTAVLRIQLTHATKTRSTRPRSTADFLLTAQQRPTRAAGQSTPQSQRHLFAVLSIVSRSFAHISGISYRICEPITASQLQDDLTQPKCLASSELGMRPSWIYQRNHRLHRSYRKGSMLCGVNGSLQV
jgi:hypothetical protein